MSIKTITQLKSQILKKVNDSVCDDIIELIVNVWKNLMSNLYYNEYEPQQYERTMQMLNSIRFMGESKSSDGFVISIGMDKQTYLEPYGNISIEKVWENSELGIRYYSSGKPVMYGGHVYEILLDYLNSNLFQNDLKVIFSKYKSMGF